MTDQLSLLRRPLVEAAFGIRRSSVYRHVDEGLLTRPVAVGSRAVRWPSNEIRALVAARVAGKSDDEIRALVARLHSARGAAVARTA